MIERLDDGYYLVRQDSPDPMSVSKTVYGDARQYKALLDANPEEWFTGDRLTVPNKAGRATIVRESEGPFDLIGRMFPGQPVHIYLDLFFEWNGGESYEPQSSELVFVPER